MSKVDTDATDGQSALLKAYIAHFFPSSDVTAQEAINSNPDVRITKGNKTLRVDVGSARFNIRREENFTAHERELLQLVSKKLTPFFNQPDINAVVFHSLIESFFDEAVLTAFLSDIGSHDETLVEKFIEKLSFWRNKTHEGKSVSFGILVASANSQSVPNASGINLFDVIEEDYMAPVSDGVNSFIEIDGNGTVIGYRQIDTYADASDLPYRFSSLTDVAEKAVVLTRLGDILLIEHGKLLYVKKDRQWIRYSDTWERRLSATLHIKDERLRRAIYQTCIDVSFAKTGCVLAIIKPGRFDLSEIIESGVRQSGTYQNKERFFTTVHGGKRFQELPRLVRKELAGIDGSFIINTSGDILSAGAIVKIDGGSPGGGRTAAAIKMSQYGAGIKVSEDGYIELYRDGKLALKID